MKPLEQHIRSNMDEQFLIPELTVENICDAQQRLNAVNAANLNNFTLLIKAEDFESFKANPAFENWVDYATNHDKLLNNISGYVGMMLGLLIYSDFGFQEKDKFLTSSMLVKLKTTLTVH